MISVDGLVAVPSLGLSYAAGRVGGFRLVTWAHVCDLPDPWEWHDAGDLVMTTGTGLPATAGEQAVWIGRLIDSGVSALVIARKPDAPKVSAELEATAERRNFPVLVADFKLPFVQLARTVIESAVQNERTRLALIDRLYDAYWRALHTGASIEERLTVLERVTGWAISVLDVDRGEAFARGAVAKNRHESAADVSSQSTTVPIADGAMSLVVEPHKNEIQSRSLVQHVSGLIALELEHYGAQRDHLRRSGQDLLAGLVEESITLPGVWPELRHRGLLNRIVVACWRLSSGADPIHEGIQRDVLLQKSAPLLMPRDGSLIGIIPDDRELVGGIGNRLGPNCVVGLSAGLTINSSVPEATRQAQLAAALALESGAAVVSYDELDATASLRGSVEDARRLVSRILGPLIAEDMESSSDLVRSVHTFLQCDGAWQKSAERLGIHRQTLVYRLRKVERLIGLKPTTTKGSALLWLAFEAGDRANLDLAEAKVVLRPKPPRPSPR